MKFEFSRNFLMGLAVAGLMSSCGIDSPDEWAQAPMPGAGTAPEKPKKAPEAPKPEAAKPVASTPAPTAAEAPSEEAKKASLWDIMSGKNKAPKEEPAAVAESAPQSAPAQKVEAPSPQAAPATKNKGGYPTAERVKYNKGWVYSPYDSRKINVRGVSSGSLVADPRYPLDQKKYFRVP